MSLRILALTNLYPNPWQPGRAPFNRQLFRALAAQHALAVIAPIAWTDEIAARWRGANGLPSDRRENVDGINVDHPRYLFPPNMFRGSYGYWFSRSVRGCFERAVAEFQPNIVYGSWAYPDGWAAVELGRRARLPVAVRVHGSDIHLLGSYRGRKRGTCQALAGADAVIAPSRALAARVSQLGADPQRVHVVYNGVDTGRFFPGDKSEARQRLGLPLDTPIVLFVGNMIAVKGVDVLIDACRQLAADKISFTCYLIGQGPLAGQIERQIGELGLSAHIKLIGPQLHEQLADWYRAADVLALPSRSEGVPNVLLEAMACGTSFVASDVGGVAEVAFRGQGRLVPPDDPRRLAAAINEQLSAPADRLVSPAGPPRSFDDSAAELSGILQGLIEPAMLPMEST